MMSLSLSDGIEGDNLNDEASDDHDVIRVLEILRKRLRETPDCHVHKCWGKNWKRKIDKKLLSFNWK